MISRITSAVVLLPLLILVIWAGSLWFSLLVVIVVALGSVEFCRLATKWGMNPIVPVATTWAVVLVAGAHFVSAGPSIPAVWLTLNVIVTISLFAAVSSFVLMLGISRGRYRLSDWVVTNISALYTGGLLSYSVLTRGLEQGREWVLLSVVVIVVADTSALIVGKLVGRHPLAPKISPQKTLEGSLGGFLGGICSSVIFVGLLDLPMTIGFSGLFGLGLTFVGQFGDLIQSGMKRAAGVKDSGHIIPGHGGLLDRLDSIVFNMPLVYYFVLWGTQ